MSLGDNFIFLGAGFGAAVFPLCAYLYGCHNEWAMILLILAGGFIGLVSGGMLHDHFFDEKKGAFSRSKEALVKILGGVCFLVILVAIGILGSR